MTPAFVGVEWDDAHGSAAETVAADDLAEHHHACVTTTFGFLLKFDETGLSLANEVDKETGYRGHTFIPRANVRAVWRVAARPFTKRNALFLREQLSGEVDT